MDLNQKPENRSGVRDDEVIIIDDDPNPVDSQSQAKSATKSRRDTRRVVNGLEHHHNDRNVMHVTIKADMFHKVYQWLSKNKTDRSKNHQIPQNDHRNHSLSTYGSVVTNEDDSLQNQGDEKYKTDEQIKHGLQFQNDVPVQRNVSFQRHDSIYHIPIQRYGNIQHSVNDYHHSIVEIENYVASEKHEIVQMVFCNGEIFELVSHEQFLACGNAEDEVMETSPAETNDKGTDYLEHSTKTPTDIFEDSTVTQADDGTERSSREQEVASKKASLSSTTSENTSHDNSEISHPTWRTETPNPLCVEETVERNSNSEVNSKIRTCIEGTSTGTSDMDNSFRGRNVIKTVSETGDSSLSIPVHDLTKANSSSRSPDKYNVTLRKLKANPKEVKNQQKCNPNPPKENDNPVQITSIRQASPLPPKGDQVDGYQSQFFDFVLEREKKVTSRIRKQTRHNCDHRCPNSFLGEGNYPGHIARQECREHGRRDKIKSHNQSLFKPRRSPANKGMKKLKIISLA